MRNLRNEKGIALVTSLLLTLISLAIVMAVIYLLTLGTQVSGSQKRYRTTMEATYGGLDTMTKIVIPQAFQDTVNPPSGLLLDAVFANYANHFQAKLNNSRGKWASLGLNANELSLDPANTPDVTFTLNGPPLQPNYTIYAKIVDTNPGNSDTTGTELDSGSGVSYTGSGVSPQHIPATYRIELQGQKQNNPKEKAKLTVFYAY
jgi:hypothetical protein